MYLMTRADDLGLSEGVNYGILSTVQKGTITCVGLMVNMPASQHGFNLVKDYEIALGLHVNICLGKPISSPERIPSLVDANGLFHTSKTINQRQKDTIDITECERELEAQLQRFQHITNRLPDYFEGHAVFSKNFIIALKNVAKKYHLFFAMPNFDTQWEKDHGIFGLKMPTTLQKNGVYDPQHYFTESLHQLKANPCSIAVFHPGFIDQFLVDHSSYTTVRIIEQQFLCSDWFQQFLKTHHITLTNFKTYQQLNT